MLVKRDLAREVTAELYSREAAIQAQAHYDVSQRGLSPGSLRPLTVPSGITLAQALHKYVSLPSLSEAKRVITQGGAATIDGAKITDPDTKITSELIVKIGKRGYQKFIPE